MKKIFRKEFIIGGVTLIALLVLFFGLNYLKGVNLFHPSNYYFASFENVDGLAESSAIRLNGFKVGLVREIQYEYDNPGHVLVELSLDNQLKIPQGSEVMLVSDILGTASLELKLGTSSELIPVGGKLQGLNKAGMMAAISDQVLPSVGPIFAKIDTLLSSLNTIMADPALSSSVKRIDGITSDLNQTTAALSRLMASLPPIVSNVNGITDRLNTASENVAHITSELNSVPLDSMANNILATTQSLRQLTAEMNNPNSTLGKLMNDPALYNNLNNTIQSLDSLFVDLQKNPKRYISIKLL